MTLETLVGPLVELYRLRDAMPDGDDAGIVAVEDRIDTAAKLATEAMLDFAYAIAVPAAK